MVGKNIDRFEQINRVVEVTYQLRTKSPVFVGSGYENIPITEEELENLNMDMNERQLSLVAGNKGFNPVKFPLEYEGTYVIPGSTIKGLSRSRVELYTEERPCFIKGNSYINSDCDTHHTLFEITKQSNPKDDWQCWICDIYGSFKQGKSKVEFEDAKLLSKYQPKQITISDHGTENLLVFPKDASLLGTIRMYNLSAKEEAIIAQSLGLFNKEGRVVGYSKYRKRLDGDDQPLVLGEIKFLLYKTFTYKPDKNGVLRCIDENLPDEYDDLSKKERRDARMNRNAENRDKYLKRWQNAKPSYYNTKNEITTLAKIRTDHSN